jgi:hypothetical protein
MPQGAAPVTPGCLLGNEKLVGVYMQEVGSGLTKLVVQTLVSGQAGEAATEQWRDVEVAVAGDNIPATGYVSEPLGIAAADIVDGKFFMFPRTNAGYPLNVVRLRGEGTLATNNAIFQFIGDPHG